MALSPTQMIWHGIKIRGTATLTSKNAASATPSASCLINNGQQSHRPALMVAGATPAFHPASRRFWPDGIHHQHRNFADRAREATQDMNTMTPQQMATLQNELLQEASSLTRALYRKCLKSIELLAEGNSRDEDDFSERESEELDGGGVNLERISMAPPVNRRNELSSRADYYRTFARENFDGHWSLLGAYGFHIGDEGSMTHGLGHRGGGNQYQGGHHHLGGQMAAQYQYGEGKNNISSGVQQENNVGKESYMWREDQIEKFIYLIRAGEENRRWILNDYEFKDPYNTANPTCWSEELEERLNEFEARSSLLVMEMYKRKGWTHSSVFANPVDDDGFFSDIDSGEERE